MAVSSRNVAVAVVGGGPSGMIAALAAARLGADVLLIEQYGHLGGMAASGLPLLAFLDKEGNKAIGGIPDEFIEVLKTLGGSPGHIRVKSPHNSFTPVEPEIVKYAAMKMAAESGVEVMLSSTVVDVLLERGAVRGLVVSNRSGIHVVTANVVIDASGNGDMAAVAGAHFEKGRAEDGFMQPVSLVFRVGNVDGARVAQYLTDNPEENVLPHGSSGGYTIARVSGKPMLFVGGFNRLVAKAREAGEFTIPRERILVNTLPNGREVAVNSTRVHGVDGTIPSDLTAAYWRAQTQVMELCGFLRKYVRGFENSYLVETFTQMGVRETRRVVGECTLTVEDIMSGVARDDSICLASSAVDLHDPTGMATTLRGPNRPYGVPYGCLVPNGVDGLIMTGRCISATHEAQAAVRLMPICMAMGQAAGTAAALAVSGHVPPRSVHASSVREALIENGAVL